MGKSNVDCIVQGDMARLSQTLDHVNMLALLKYWARKNHWAITLLK